MARWGGENIIDAVPHDERDKRKKVRGRERRFGSPSGRTVRIRRLDRERVYHGRSPSRRV